MKPCPKCGASTVEDVGDHLYEECGLDYVTISGVRHVRCSACDFHRVTLPNLIELHRVIAEAVAAGRFLVGPKEVRFLRTHLGLSKEDYAKEVGAPLSDVVAWETGTAEIPIEREVELRLLVLTRQPVAQYQTPPERLQRPRRPTPVNVRRVDSHWSAAAP